MQQTLSLSLQLALSSGGPRPNGDGVAPPLPVALSVPAGFPVVPRFTVFRDQFGTYTHDFAPGSLRPAHSHTIYCGKGGNNANDGTSWANRVRSIKQALVRAGATGGATAATQIRILIEVGQYRFSEGDGSGVQDSWAGQLCSRNLQIEPCDGAGKPVATGRVVSIHDQVMPAFTRVLGSVYVSTYTTELPHMGVWDSSRLDGYGNPQALHPAPPATSYANEAAIVAGVEAMHLAYGEGACWLDGANKKLYVRLVDGRAPDIGLTVGRGAEGSLASNTSWNLVYQGIWQNAASLWLSRFETWGGGGFYIYPDWGANRRVTVVLDRCRALYSCSNGVSVLDSTKIYLHGCQVGYVNGDGIGYLIPGMDSFTPDAAFTGSISGTTLTVTGVADLGAGVIDIGMVIAGANVTSGSTVTGFGTGTGGTGTYLLDRASSAGSTALSGNGGMGGCRAHELDCMFYWCGNHLAGDSSRNASSSHKTIPVVRVNSHASLTQNRAFHDIEQSKSWNLGCSAQNCRLSGAPSGAFVSGYDPNSQDTAEMWLDGCRSIGNDYDFQTYKGGKIYLTNMGAPGAFATVGGGAISTY